MTLGELKERIRAMKRGEIKEAITLHDREVMEYVKGYNRAIEDILSMMGNLKKKNDGKKDQI